MRNNSRTTVALLCDYKSLYGGNFIASLLSLEEYALSKQYHFFYIFPLEAANRFWLIQLQSLHKNVILIDFNNSRISKLYCLNKIIKDNKIDILHVHFGELFNTALLDKLNCKIKIIWHLHSDFSLGSNLGLKERIRYFILFKVFGRGITKISVAKHMIFDKSSTYIPNGINTNRFNNPADLQSVVFLKNNISIDDRIILMFGWSPIVKGVDIAVKTVDRLFKLGECNLKLAIICGRTVNKSKMKKYIEENTDCTGDEPWLCYLDPIEDVFLYMELSDIVLSSSRSEGFPYSILEALVMEKECVVSNIPGTKWALHYDTVFSFENGDVESCVDTVQKLLKIRTPQIIKNNVAEQVRQDYSVKKWCSQVLNVYESLF